MRETAPGPPSQDARAAWDADSRRRSAHMRRVVEGVMGVPAVEGNRVEVLRNGVEIFPAMLQSIAGAERTIDFLTFVYWEGEIGRRFAHALAERARAGVRVRVLLDSWGASSIEKAAVEEMEGAGVDVEWFRPIVQIRPQRPDHRTHRKILLVDEKTGFTGGVGIADEWQGDARDETEWRDTHFRIEGPAVDGLRGAFLDDWIESSDALFSDVDRFPQQPVAGPSLIQCIRGESTTGWSDIHTLFCTLLQLAEHRVRLTTAYFAPDARLIDQLLRARGRDVEVEILLPGPHIDKRFVQLAGQRSYGDLLEAGVQIWQYQPSMLHAKIMLVDGIAANIGSANLNGRSAKLDDEVNLVVYDPDVVRVLSDQFDDDLERSERIESKRWRRRPLKQKVLEQAAAMLKPEV
mgnify:CR=1 FL=1